MDTGTPDPDETSFVSQKHGDNKTVDRYVLLEPLGEGGMGAVYKAFDPKLKRHVAIKVLAHSSLEPTALQRFQAEARAGGKIKHTNVIDFFDFGITNDGKPYLVMELVSGKTLQELLQEEGCISFNKTIEIIRPLCSAIAAAHAKGIVHRDLKPANIILDDSKDEITPKLLDFGVSKIIDSLQVNTLTKSGHVLGSPLYLSPEQAQASKIDGRSDIYSLACVIFKCLTGKPPFRGESALETTAMHVSEPAPGLRETKEDADFPDELESVIATALAKDPADRFETIEDFHSALESTLEEKDSEQENEAARTNKTGVVAVLVLIGCCMVAGTVYWISSSKSPAADQIEKRSAQELAIEPKEKVPPKPDEMLNFKNGFVEPRSTSNFSLRRLIEQQEKVGGYLKLDLSSRDLSSENLQELEKLRLSELNLSYCNLSDDALKHLTNQKQLQALKLDNNNFSVAGLKRLKSLKRLTHLYLKSNPAIDSDAVSFIARTYPRLRSLDLENTKVSAGGLKDLGKLRHLKYIQASRLDLADADVETISKLPELGRIMLRDNTRLTGASLEALLKPPKLTSVEIVGCTSITDAAVNRFRRLKPGCRIKHRSASKSGFAETLLEAEENRAEPSRP